MVLDLKKINFIIYWNWTRKILELLYSTRTYFMIYWELDLKSNQTTLLGLDWFYDTLDLDLKSTLTNLLGSDWFYYNEAEMPLEKYENLFELPVKQESLENTRYPNGLSHWGAYFGGCQNWWPGRFLVYFVKWRCQPCLPK